MKLSLWYLVWLFFGVACGPQAVAQAATSAPLQADYIAAVVNSEPITNSELVKEIARVKRQLVKQNQSVPPAQELRKAVLERLINDHAQLQLALENGVRVDDGAIDQAELSIARQNRIDLDELHTRLGLDGLSVADFRRQLRDQLTLTRLHEREVNARIRVTDGDVERYLQEMQAINADPLAQEINLGQILFAVPERATVEDAAVIFTQAKRVLDRIRAGEDFRAMAEKYSAADRANGGQMGLRRADRYPPAFVAATQKLEVGAVSDIVRSGAGFHILKVLERRSPSGINQFVVQTHVRHILLRLGSQLSQVAAETRLAELKQRMQTGASSFQTVAKDFSQDGSAAQGGDLGWATAGMFVPEFEEVMDRLAEGEISNPVVSRFGVHLIQVLERRRVELGPVELREAIRNQIRDNRYEEAFASWANEVRSRAFVEVREPPQ
jgi:peptidyl-prolyl cis-trans isomerase SurA